ncbi:hypothetical protein LJC68_03010 [Bacteroidales bacterium OttesenSCG-928-B11]|nr:hypothetical protein [Bacteroidales bacterium OttesenSCG-928-C03]MDL2311831.1 hypothetical protein [Bacteroidales bacterium OttesenSCG-928-B11]MDL2325520.1 hypothetical protein [Bacteroidales bacterium OttesenSCG-928-A14]
MPSITKESFVEVIGAKFPLETIDFVYDIFSSCECSLKTSRPRISKKGDFRYDLRGGKIPVITINCDLCPHEFLLVYLHEVAHYNVSKKYNIQKVKAHGVEWKNEYLSLLIKLLETCQLPKDIEQAFVKHGQKVKSSSALDQDLEDVFQRYRTHNETITHLNTLHVGDRFILRKEPFELNQFLRTRALCTNLRTNRRFYVQGTAPVIKID